jgi:hypothetical protein
MERRELIKEYDTHRFVSWGGPEPHHGKTFPIPIRSRPSMHAVSSTVWTELVWTILLML